MTPNYLDLRCCDNMELMAQYPDKHFDLAIVDLEYGLGASSPSRKPEIVRQKSGKFLRVVSNQHEKKDWDFKKSGPEYFNQLFRCSQNQIIWGGNYYGLSGGYVVWDKMNGESDQFGCEMAWTSFSNRTDIIHFMWSGMIQGMIVSKDFTKAKSQQGNKSLNEKRIHPTQKPVALYKWLLKNYAKPGDKILDTHLGSMSIAIAVHEMNKQGMNLTLTGCELDADYYKQAVDRVEKHCLQQDLFAGITLHNST